MVNVISIQIVVVPYKFIGKIAKLVKILHFKFLEINLNTVIL